LTLTGTTDNGVITLNSSAPNGTVESNLTFNGSELGLTGDLKIDGSITAASGNNITLNPEGTGDILLKPTNLLLEGAGTINTAEFRFQEATGFGSNYIGFQAPSSIATNQIYTLPLLDGTSGQVLSTNGSGVLSFITAGGGGGISFNGSTANGLVTFQDSSTAAVESTITSTGGNLTMTGGDISFANQASTYLTSFEGGGAGSFNVGIGDITDANSTFLKVDGVNNNIVLSEDTDTVTFDSTNGLVATTDIKGPTIHGTNTSALSIRGYGKSIFGNNGTGIASTSHQFKNVSGDGTTFLTLDSDGEETFKIQGNIAGNTTVITIGDIGEANNGNILVLDDGNQKGYFTNASSDIKVGINTATPDQEFHVVGNARFGQRHYVTEAPASAGASEGEVVTFGSGTTVAGKLYHYNGTGWNLTNSNPATSAATSGSLVAMALGTSPITNGMLLRGIARPLLSGGAGGNTVYFDGTDGQLTTTVPTTSGYIVRVAGHCLDANTIYFNPSPDWIILA